MFRPCELWLNVVAVEFTLVTALATAGEPIAKATVPAASAPTNTPPNPRAVMLRAPHRPAFAYRDTVARTSPLGKMHPFVSAGP